MAKSKAPTREELVALAEEMNAVMGLDPAIKIKKKDTDEEVIEKIKAEAEIYETDFQPDPDDEDKEYFTDEAAKLFKKLGIEVVVADDATEDTDEDIEDEDEETEEEEEVVEEPAPKKGKGKKVVEPEPEDEEEEVVEEKPAKKTKAAKAEEKPAKAEKAPKKEKAEKVSRISREEVFAKFVKDGKPHTKDEMIQNQLDEYGGTENWALYQVNTFVRFMVYFGMMEQTDKGYKFLKK